MMHSTNPLIIIIIINIDWRIIGYIHTLCHILLVFILRDYNLAHFNDLITWQLFYLDLKNLVEH